MIGRYLQSATVDDPIQIFVGSCPDYSHDGNLYTHEGLGDKVPLLTKLHLQYDIQFLSILKKYNIPFSYTIMIADVEAVDEVFCNRFTDGERGEFLSRCTSSQYATEEAISKLPVDENFKTRLRSSSFFTEFSEDRFLHFQDQYLEILKERINIDSSFQVRVFGDIAARMHLYRKMYGQVLNYLGGREKEDFLVSRTLRTMAQYLTLGKLISESAAHPLVINHRTRNIGLFNDRNKFMLKGEVVGQQLPVPVMILERNVY